MNFKKEIADFVFTSRYARYNEKLERRETWEETIDRVLHMHLKKFKHLELNYLEEIKEAFSLVKEKKVVPSMRSLQFGGKAIETNNTRIYNCSVLHISSIRSFAEVFYLLLCGTGVGAGVTRHFLNRLPDLVDSSNKTGTVLTYVIEDTIEGWADSLEALLSCYFRNTAFTGRRIIFDYSKIRKKGEPLKTSGGKAPGYLGLKYAHQKIKSLLDHIIEDLYQSRLKPINAYDIMMHASDAVLSGGIRRSAMIVIFDVNDEEMMNSKTYFKVDRIFRFSYDEETDRYYGKIKIDKKIYELEITQFEYEDLKKNNRISWFYVEPQRGRSNNSILLLRDECKKENFEKIIQKTKEFGEPGFVFADNPFTLFNPCSEIGFIPVTSDGICGIQFCNLTSINGAKINDLNDFQFASRAASLIGTLQASYTQFKYFQPATKELTEEESLLGVSITGIMDNPDILLNSDNQSLCAKIAVETNKKWSKILGINQAARVTCIKPEGSSSLVLESASGIHPHHARKYFRRVQCNKLDPIYKFFKKYNVHMCEDSVWSANKTDGIITFPIEVSDKALIKKDLSALKHLEYIKLTQEYWVKTGTTEANKKSLNHSVSCTVIVKEEEWKEVIEYIYKNRNYFSAVSFVPALSDKIYKQAPMEEVVTEEDTKKWEEIRNNFKHVDYKELKEENDQTNLTREFSCAGGLCEIA